MIYQMENIKSRVGEFRAGPAARDTKVVGWKSSEVINRNRIKLQVPIAYQR
jgi:hypothetical protein